jgi:hypothetical protein
MELEELRQRLLLRSKSTEIPPIAHPVQIADLALGTAAGKQIKWETTFPPDLANRAPAVRRPENNSGYADHGDAGRADESPAPAKGMETERERPSNIAAANGKIPAMPAAPSSVEPMSIIANEANQLSEPTEAFREHFAQLAKLLQPIDIATQSTEQALGRIAGLHAHLSGLANTFQSVKAFAEQVKSLSATFEPMQGLNQQLDQVIGGFYLNVKELGTALEPVKAFQLKVRQLATTLDSIKQLEGQILDLAEAFRPGSEKPAQQEKIAERQKPAPDKLAAVSQAA